jgi:hypothetical protein
VSKRIRKNMQKGKIMPGKSDNKKIGRKEM